MKLFAILTAGLMAAGGGVYFYSTSSCSKSGCSLRDAAVAKTGGCCQTGETSECGAAKEEAGVISDACSSVAARVNATAKPSCCAVEEECCLVAAACCTAEKVRAAAKPIEIKGCCDESCASPTQTVTTAAKSIASVK